MSAFVVSDAHLNALIATAIHGPKDAPEVKGTWRVWHRSSRAYATLKNANKIGAMLLAENLASYNSRYPEKKNEAEDADAVSSFRFSAVEPLTRIQAFKAVDCLKYQSCQHEKWISSEAEDFLNSLRSALIQSLPGYANADWEIS